METTRFAIGVRDLFRAIVMSGLDRTTYGVGGCSGCGEDVTAAAAKVSKQLATFEALVSAEALRVADVLGYTRILQRGSWIEAVGTTLSSGDLQECHELLAGLQSCSDWVERWYRHVGPFANESLALAVDRR